jgi:hypothetical protein
MALEFLIPIAFFISAASVAGNLIRLKQRKLELQAMQSGGGGSIDARLERMELAIDAMAVEMERLAEGQRFTTQLLAGDDDGRVLGRGRDS